MPDEKIILPDSDEAATLQTVTCWVTRHGYLTKDEHHARYAGSTHIRCKSCKGIHPKDSYCRPCSDKKRCDKFESMEVIDWDGQSCLSLFDSEQYFLDMEYFYEYCDDNEIDPNKAQLVQCVPDYMSQTWKEGNKRVRVENNK